MYPKYTKRNLQIDRQNGIGLPATIFLIVVLSLIVVAMSDLTESSNLGFGQNLNSMRAFYAAESGAQIALNRVFVGGDACSNVEVVLDFNASNQKPGLINCTATTSCEQNAVLSVNYYTFLSAGRCGAGFEQSQRSIEVRAHD